MKPLIHFLVLTLWLSSCVVLSAKELYIKKIEVHDLKVEWFYFSHITSITPEYIVAYHNNEADTVCISHNIHNVSITEDQKIQINFHGKPQRGGVPILLPESVFNYQIVVDTTAEIKKLKPLKSFK